MGSVNGLTSVWHECLENHASFFTVLQHNQLTDADLGPKMETLPHPRDFMGSKWQDRVRSGDIKSGVCKMKCSALRFYATLSAKRSHIYMVGSGCGCLSVKQSFHQLYS